MTVMKQGVFIEGIRVPSACAGNRCPFYKYGDQSGPDYCMIQVAQGVSPFSTKLNILDCPMKHCEAHKRED